MTVASSSPSYSVALAFEDGVTRFISCRADQTVADASYRQRINIPLDCRDGACGTCKAFCESGTYRGGDYIDDALSADEAAAGYVLPCCMQPDSDLVLQIHSTSDIAKTEAATYTGTLVGLDHLSDSTIRFSVDIPNRAELAFLPGQYVNIEVPGTEPTLTRSYSFANAPHEDRLSFLVKLTRGGSMSEYLAQRAAVGDRITFTGPHGSFFLREADRPMLMVAGGTGLAPILSMLRTLRAAGSQRKVHLIYGVKTDTDVVELDTLAETAQILTGFTWDHCVSDPATHATNQGRVMTLIHPEQLYQGDVAVYLCGPPAMVDSVRTHISGFDIEPNGFYYEKFASAAGAQSASASDATPTAPATAEPVVQEPLLLPPDARAVTGQVMLTAPDIAALHSTSATAQGDLARRIVGQVMLAGGTAGALLDADCGEPPASGARSLAGQLVFAPSFADSSVLPVNRPSQQQSSRSATPQSRKDSTTEQPKFCTPDRFDGKVVVITGAAQGIGEQTARRIAAEGGTLVLADRSELVKELAHELSALPVTVDLEHWEGAYSAVQQVLSEYGRIDVLINNVGGAINFKPFTEFTDAEIRAEIDRSLMTTLYACRAVLPSMVARGDGVIVNVSSAATRGIHRIPYSAAKGGINAITASLAMEYADNGIRVVATAPGGTQAPPRRVSRGTPPLTTATEQTWFDAHIDQTLNSSLMHRYGTLDEQAAAICFQASQEASYITGTVLPVAGGDQG